MVLVGHSMGGLIARLQTIESGNEFWKIVSDQPFQMVKASDDVRQELADAFFFHPNPSVRRVITLGTPYHGSEFSNSTTRWIGSKLIKIPKMFVSGRQQLHHDNPDLFKQPSLIDVDTSIDSLAPESPFLPVMLTAPEPPFVHNHTIIGVVSEKGLIGRVVGEGDGVVSYASAHLDTAESEIVVNADHTTVHSHPLSVLEVHRILLAHLAEVDRQAPNYWKRPPMTAQASPGAPPYAPQPLPDPNGAAFAPQASAVQMSPAVNGAPNPSAQLAPPGPPLSGPLLPTTVR